MYKKLKISILLFLPFIVFGQKTSKEWLSDANTYFENHRYNQSLAAYMEYRKVNPRETQILTNMANCAYEIGAYDEAKRYLTYAFEQKNIDEKAYWIMANILHSNGEYKDAIAYYKKYLTAIKRSAANRRMVKERIKQCATGLNFTDNNAKVFVQNMGDKVNGVGDDFAPIISPTSSDKIYYSSAREGSVGGLRNDDGIRDDKFGTFCSDMFVTKVTNGDWAEPKALSYLINSPRHDVVLDFSTNGTMMYYFKGYSLFSGEIYVDTFKTFDDRTLSSTPFKSPMDASYGDGTPFFVNDTLLLFSSRRAGGFGGADLYYSLYQNNQWQMPRNMGNRINSGYDEVCPFLATDGRTLYFSNNSCNGIGDLDIYKSVFDDKTLTWAVPENMGLPINSPGEDAFFKLSDDGSKGFFSSKRKDGLGNRDLYIAYFKTPLAEQENISEPDYFFKVKPSEVAASEEDNPNKAPKIITYKFSSIGYDKDADLVSAKNKATLDDAVSFLSKNESVKVTIVSHSEETATLDLDAFLSVKRAEKVADYFLKNGCKPQQINMLGAGSSYPIAKNTIDGNPNKIGQKFNRRLDLYFQNYQKLPVKLEFEDNIIPDYMQSEEHFRFKNIFKGLSYRVQVASMKQIYQGDVLKKFPDVMVNRSANSDLYDFSIGIFVNFANADRLQRDLTSQGITTATVVPYINGFSIVNNVKDFVNQYPDLNNFLKKTGK